ncbi:MAG: hypothetical protein KTR30_33510 [Saprospiraceae bacterium]|nr:hypothetical protein [Saprospiraceae bacterium]
MILQFFIRNYKVAKIIVVSLLAILLVVDVILVFRDDIPTYSAFIKENRTRLLWLTFTLGGLTSKIYYNRSTSEILQEINGFLSFLFMVIIVLMTGLVLSLVDGLVIPTFVQLLVLLSGGYLSHRFWPQYQKM